MLALAGQLSNLSANTITGHVIPTAYYWHTSPVGDVGIVHPADVGAVVKRWMSPGHHGSGHGARAAKKAKHAVDSGCIN